MRPFASFFGNDSAAATLVKMIGGDRLAQTILLSGPEGVGKATLARRFAAALLEDGEKIERDDLSRPENLAIIEERDKWTADKRADDPLLFSSHPDFITFAPEGPLRQITIQQMRLLRQRAQFKPLRGKHRVFLIDHLERANEQAANSLLKVLEEPPEHLILIATAENLYDLLPTIRSRALILQLCRVSDDDMAAFAEGRGLPEGKTRIAIAQGCPGAAAVTDLELFRSRREFMLSALECAAGLTSFAVWVQQSETFSTRKSEKLELYLRSAYDLLGDLLAVTNGHAPVLNRDVEKRLRALAARIDFRWIEKAAGLIDELGQMVRRNIQKTGALDAMIVKLRNQPMGIRA